MQTRSTIERATALSRDRVATLDLARSHAKVTNGLAWTLARNETSPARIGTGLAQVKGWVANRWPIATISFGLMLSFGWAALLIWLVSCTLWTLV